jgi:hypothetical protein
MEVPMAKSQTLTTRPAITPLDACDRAFGELEVSVLPELEFLVCATAALSNPNDDGLSDVTPDALKGLSNTLDRLKDSITRAKRTLEEALKNAQREAVN